MEGSGHAPVCGRVVVLMPSAQITLSRQIQSPKIASRITHTRMKLVGKIGKRENGGYWCLFSNHRTRFSALLESLAESHTHG